MKAILAKLLTLGLPILFEWLAKKAKGLVSEILVRIAIWKATKANKDVREQTEKAQTVEERDAAAQASTDRM